MTVMCRWSPGRWWSWAWPLQPRDDPMARVIGDQQTLNTLRVAENVWLSRIHRARSRRAGQSESRILPPNDEIDCFYQRDKRALSSESGFWKHSLAAYGFPSACPPVCANSCVLPSLGARKPRFFLHLGLVRGLHSTGVEHEDRQWQAGCKSPQRLEVTAMKTALCMLLVFCASCALAQSVVSGTALNNQATVVQFASHPQQALQQDPKAEQSLLFSSPNVSAHGELPLWEVAPVAENVPLGDIARVLRKAHEQAKKATVVWTN
jgi:hypothetical protein